MQLLLSRFFGSSIGLKLAMAVSGFMMVGFLLAHLSGNLLVFAGADAINAYARGLRNFLPVLWFLRLGLIFSVMIHISSALALTKKNRSARPKAYATRSWRTTSTSAKSMMLTGLVILSFVIFHLLHLTFHVTHVEFKNLAPFDVYSTLMISFKSPALCFFYALSVILLMTHLSHGITSFFQTIGFRHKAFQPLIDKLGPCISFALSLGYLSIPLSIYFGLIG